jgi:hypothetical protein
MNQRAYLKICKSCGEDFAKSVTTCPHCGKKAQSGMLLMLIIGIGCLALVAALAIPVGSNRSDAVDKIASATIDPVDAAELAGIFKNKHSQTDPRAQNKAQQITGKIVQWDLEVIVCTQSAAGYQMVTKATAGVPGSLLKVYPRNNRQRDYLENLKPGNTIQVKGKISGVQQGRIKIDPALLM